MELTAGLAKLQLAAASWGREKLRMYFVVLMQFRVRAGTHCLTCSQYDAEQQLCRCLGVHIDSDFVCASWYPKEQDG